MRTLMLSLLFVLTVEIAYPTENPGQSDDGKVVFFRPKRFIGGALTPSVYVNEIEVARLDNGRYFTIGVPPGKHIFDSSMKKHSPLQLEVAPGETVYIEMLILVGNWRGGGRLVPAPEEEANEQIRKLKPLDAKWVKTPQMLWTNQRQQNE